MAVAVLRPRDGWEQCLSPSPQCDRYVHVHNEYRQVKMEWAAVIPEGIVNMAWPLACRRRRRGGARRRRRRRRRRCRRWLLGSVPG